MNTDTILSTVLTMTHFIGCYRANLHLIKHKMSSKTFFSRRDEQLEVVFSCLKMYLKFLLIFLAVSSVFGDYYSSEDSYYYYDDSSEDSSGEFVSMPLSYKTFEDVVVNNEIVFVKFFKEA